MRFGYRDFILLLLFPVITIAGCEQPKVEFIFSEKTNELMPAAAKPVKEALVREFGNPLALTQFEGLPTKFGDVEGKVKSVETSGADAPLIRFQTTGLENAYDKLQGLPLEWTSGKAQGQI